MVLSGKEGVREASAPMGVEMGSGSLTTTPWRLHALAMRSASDFSRTQLSVEVAAGDEPPLKLGAFSRERSGARPTKSGMS